MVLSRALKSRTHDVVGRGGSGIVHKGVVTRRLGQPEEVAAKTLLPGATVGAEKRFLKETQAAFKASQTCSGACRMYGCAYRDGALCLVMKLYPRSLYIFLDSRKSRDGTTIVQPLSRHEVLSFAEQILVALAQLHAEGIVVQDLMDEHDQLAVSDFGLAVALQTTNETTQATTVAGGGTPAYTAPEQYDAETFGRSARRQICERLPAWSCGNAHRVPALARQIAVGDHDERGSQETDALNSIRCTRCAEDSS